MAYIVDRLGNDLDHYRELAENEDTPENLRTIADVISSYTSNLLCLIADGQITMEPEEE